MKFRTFILTVASALALCGSALGHIPGDFDGAGATGVTSIGGAQRAGLTVRAESSQASKATKTTKKATTVDASSWCFYAARGTATVPARTIRVPC
jgi:hypothetical protein